MDIEQTLQAMTLDEKASLLSGDGEYWTQAIPSVDLPAIEVGDGPHGLRKETGVDMVWIPATGFPTGSALGATWDRDLVRRVGVALGQEARAEGVQVLLGPGVNMKRTPLCGRNFEYLAEDPVLAGELGAAYVEGVQSQGVAACVKHFAANNQETNRTRISVEADERTLRELYLAAFERVVARADPWTVMSAYNRLHGTPADRNSWLLTQVLRAGWGYDGVVLSDWDSVQQRVPALEAGLDLQMPGTGGRHDAEVAAAVRSGALDESVVDRSVRRILRLVERTASAAGSGAVVDLGIVPGRPLTPAQLDALGAEEHHALAREAAAACLTLLRNERDVLPLAADAPGTIAVIGAYARAPRIQGGGSSGVEPTRVDRPLDALRAVAGERVVFADGYHHAPLNNYQDVEGEFQGGGTTGSDGTDGAADAAQATRLADEAVALACTAGVVLAYVGLPLSSEVEAADRTTLALPADHVALLDRLAGLDVPVVVVLSAGSAVTMDPWHDRVDAILQTWLPGQAGAGAVVDVLFGRANPSGRLAETFPVALTDTPGYVTFPGERGTVTYGEGVFIGYRWYDTLARAVRYPFGHGLSYTTFAYAGLDVTVTDADAGDVRVSLTVTNTGDRDGAEVVQVYVGDLAATVHRPVRELKGFAKVHLAAGESRGVEVELVGRDFAWFDVVAGGWRREAGEFRVEVGASSRDIRLVATVTLPDDPTQPPLVPDDRIQGGPASRFTEGHRAVG
ncbi:beta-glucosidase [Cellulomonas hominis]